MRILSISHEYPPMGGGANACMYLSNEYADDLVDTQVALGSLIIQKHYDYSDRELVEQKTHTISIL